MEGLLAERFANELLAVSGVIAGEAAAYLKIDKKYLDATALDQVLERQLVQ